MKDLNMEAIKAALTDMEIPYKEGGIPDNLMELIKSFGYDAIQLTADLSGVDTVDAELGVIVRNQNLEVDDGVYIFTVLHSGQAGFIVVEPGTISRAPLVRKVTGDLITAITAVELPPLMPFDMVEITAHMLAGTFMKMLMESCRIPKEYEQPFLRLYMPKFLANVGLYFVGATKEDGSPMVYEEIANMEPMMIWRSIQKGSDSDESDNAGGAGETAAEENGKDESREEAETEGQEEKAPLS